MVRWELVHERLNGSGRRMLSFGNLAAVFGLDTPKFDKGLPASEVGHRNYFRWEFRGSFNRLIATMIVLAVHRFPLGSWLWWGKYV